MKLCVAMGSAFGTLFDPGRFSIADKIIGKQGNMKRAKTGQAEVFERTGLNKHRGFARVSESRKSATILSATFKSRPDLSWRFGTSIGFS